VSPVTLVTPADDRITWPSALDCLLAVGRNGTIHYAIIRYNFSRFPTAGRHLILLHTAIIGAKLKHLTQPHLTQVLNSHQQLDECEQ